MPIYDYVCSSCGHRMEVIHGVHAAGPSECPACGGQMRKAFAPPAVHFKGTGWAKKERSSKPAKAQTAGATSEGGGSGPDSGGADSSPAAKDPTSTSASGSAGKAGSGTAGSGKD